MRIDVRGGPGRSKGLPGTPGAAQTPKPIAFQPNPKRPFAKHPLAEAPFWCPRFPVWQPPRGWLGSCILQPCVDESRRRVASPRSGPLSISFHAYLHRMATYTHCSEESVGAKKGGRQKDGFSRGGGRGWIWLKICRFRGLGGPGGPRDPLRSTGPAHHISLHQAPETNSKALSRWFNRGGLAI